MGKNQQVCDIVIDDNSKIYNIKNKQGKLLGKFSFSPSDTNILQRYKDVVDYLNNLSIPEDDADAYKTVETALKDKISYLINADADKAFFTINGPLTVLDNGEFFVESVLNAIAKVIKTEMNVRTNRVRRRLNKYTSKYHS
jgi:hypothetical protein